MLAQPLHPARDLPIFDAWLYADSRIYDPDMFLQPIDIVVYIWLTTAVLSAAYVGWDQFRGNPESTVMKWGFLLMTIYMGLIGLLLYVFADKEPRPGTHAKFVKPLWKQGVGSTVHCVAGDATGIILAAVVVTQVGLPMWQDLIVEYVAGFLFGLFIFQALFMRKIMGGTYWQNVRRSFLPELLSMNLMMAGMAPTMSFLMMGRDMRAMLPSEPLFWFVMSIGIIVGFAIAYPVNVWLVSRGLKHGLMTVQPASEHAGHGKAPSKKISTASNKHHEMSGMGEMGEMVNAVTRAQLGAISLVATLALIAGIYLPSISINLRLSARDVGGLIMPPGMIMGRDTPAEAMRDMAAVDPRDYRFRAASSERGDRRLVPSIKEGVKTFQLNISLGEWRILDDQPMGAYAVNGQVPGPRIELTEGDRVRFVVRNDLPESTTIHWHGLIVPNGMDGAAKITQPSIKPGQSFRYEFQVLQTGTYFYHSHDHPDRQQGLGLYGALIVRPRVGTPDGGPLYDLERVVLLQEWLKRDGLTYPAMAMEGGMPNYFTINGKSYPETETIRMKVGQRLKVRFIGSQNNFIHPMHIHGGPFEVVALDGQTLQPSARYMADTINVGPGQRYDVVWRANKPGKWLLHCHIPHHTTNNNVEVKGGGGLMEIIEVTP